MKHRKLLQEQLENRIAEKDEAHRQFIEWVISIAKKDQPIKILDLGCGDGSRTRFLGNYPNVELIGIDISEIGITKANKNKVGNCQYIKMAAENLDFKPNSFDLIINSTVIL